MTMQAQPAISIVPQSLQAVLDKQLGSGRPPSFQVTVDIEADIDWTIELIAATPQGINPLIKLLRFKVVLPQSGNRGMPARRSLHYQESPPAAEYSEVWLGDGDRAISAKCAIRF